MRKEKLVGAIWKADFEDKEKVRQILSKTNIIGKVKVILINFIIL